VSHFEISRGLTRVNADLKVTKENWIYAIAFLISPLHRLLRFSCSYLEFAFIRVNPRLFSVFSTWLQHDHL